MVRASDYFYIHEYFDVGKNISKKEDKIHCNIYKTLSESNRKNIDIESKMGLPLKRLSSYEAMELFKDDLNLEKYDTLIMSAGDFGIREFSISRKKFTGHQLTSNQQNFFLSIDVDPISEKFKYWFCTNLLKRFKENMYPIPIGIFPQDYEAIEKHFGNGVFEELRKVPKDNLCYANFSMTSLYRCTVAEWAFTQNYIDCYFPKRFEKQDEQLNMSILSDERIDMIDFVKTLASYSYCICPTGNGLDTHRMWECVLMNVVPIAENNYANRIFSKIWPMILVSRYERDDITKKMIEFERSHGQDINYDHDLLLSKNFDNLLERIKYECDRT